MMRIWMLTVVASLGFATEAFARCEAMATAPWASAKAYGLRLEAHAVGPDCASSAVVLIVTDKKGVVQWSTTRLALQNAMFQEGLTDNTKMKAALAAWLEQGKPTSGKDLPDWKQGKDQAERDGDGEFGFYASDSTSRDFYLDIRKQNQPLFCFVQGMESTSCIAAAGRDSISEIGGFTFPG